MNITLLSGVVARTTPATFILRTDADDYAPSLSVVCVLLDHTLTAGDIVSLSGFLVLRRLGGNFTTCVEVRHVLKRPPRNPDSGVIAM